MNKALGFGDNAEIRVLRTKRISTIVDSTEKVVFIILRTTKISTIVDNMIALICF